MNYLSEFEAALRVEGSNQLVTKVLAVVKPGILLQKQFNTMSTEQPPLLGLFKKKPIQTRQGLPVAQNSSRIGGLPELPIGAAWPSRGGKFMQFLAQINCAELVDYRQYTLLPEAGTLHFFYEEDGDESLVIMTAGDVPLQAAAAPTETGSPNFVLPQFPVTFISIPTLPHSESKEFAALELDKADVELVLNAHGTIMEEIRRKEHALHQIGGYPEAVQGDVFIECEMYSSGQKKSWAESAQSSQQWRLLLQFDTDGDLKVMWGDAGTVYFCIREDDLRASNIGKVCSTAQCY